MSTILVVDDQPTNRELLVAILAHRGHRLIEAANGLQALDEARRTPPDLVITDLLMPAMDGYELARQIRSDRVLARTPIVFYTANYFERESRALAAGCGVKFVLTKPAEPQTILAAVDRALGTTAVDAGHLPLDFAETHARVLTDKLADKVTLLERLTSRFAALIQLGQHLASERDPNRLVTRLCDEARELVCARYAVVGLLNSRHDAFRSIAASNVSPGPDAAPTLPAARSQLDLCLAQRRTVRLDAWPAGEAIPGLNARQAEGHPVLVAPVTTTSSAYGWVVLVGTPTCGPYADEDERVVTMLAGQLAVAYENALRYEQIQSHAAELERRVEERTEELKRSNEELQQFAYVASHDLQEPLRTVASYTELLARRYKGRLDETADEFIQFAVDGARRMQDLIRDLLAFSRLDSRAGTPAPVVLDRVLDDALERLQSAIDESGATITRDPLPVVIGDRRQLGQLFQNLLANAVKFRGAAAPVIHIGVVRRDDEWEFAIRDNGIGVEPQFAHRIFVLFQRLHARTEYPGTGIGLAIAKKVVDRHGGRIWVRSSPDPGATFNFTLPIKPGRDKEQS